MGGGGGRRIHGARALHSLLGRQADLGAPGVHALADAVHLAEGHAPDVEEGPRGGRERQRQDGEDAHVEAVVVLGGDRQRRGGEEGRQPARGEGQGGQYQGGQGRPGAHRGHRGGGVRRRFAASSSKTWSRNG